MAVDRAERSGPVVGAAFADLLPADAAGRVVLRDDVGGEFDLAELRGVRHGIALLPGAFTPMCTRELPVLEDL
ncbi:MAG: hypothetical protein Q4G40_05045, partial [Brachybacterium sp.]|nr:hypothetical protein [Brachybacterium sp.]